jgi:hypothetical protein
MAVAVRFKKENLENYHQNIGSDGYPQASRSDRLYSIHHISNIFKVAFLILFPLFGVAVWTIEGQLVASGAISFIMEPDACPYPPKYFSDSQLRYTGVPSVDQAVCIGVDFIKTALFRHVQPFAIYFASSLASSFLVMNIEGLRGDGPSLWFPFVATLFSFIVAAGIVVPISWLYIFLSSKRDARKSLTTGQAEALFLSHIFGYLLPTAAAVITVHELPILAWATCALWTAMLQYIWLSIRPPTGASGFWTTQLALGTALLTSAAVHLTMMVTFSRRVSPQDVIDWLPGWSIQDAKALTAEAVVLQFLQWDALFTNVSTIVVGFLYADSWPEFLLYMMATPMILLGFGPGAVISGMWMWREWKLTMLEEAEVKALKAVEKKLE